MVVMHLSMLSPRVGGGGGGGRPGQTLAPLKCQIPHPRAPTKCQFPPSRVTFSFFLATLKRQNPYPGEGTLSQFPVGSPPSPPHPEA